MSRIATKAEINRLDRINAYASTFGLVPPPPSSSEDEIDVTQVQFLSALAARSHDSLPKFVRLVRGQDEDDGRPNKSLFELPVSPYSKNQTKIRQWNDVVQRGVQPRWTSLKPRAQVLRPANHKSALRHAIAVRKHIRKGQLDGRYLVLDENVLATWPEVFLSPVGVVDKADNDTRMINDYSFPAGASVNDVTDRATFPPITYNPPSDIARRIHDLRTLYPDEEILLMLGDVSGAFRHVPVHEDAVHMFAFKFDDYVVIDLSCGFGWCGSPAYYSLAGSAINDLYESSFPAKDTRIGPEPFKGNVWCDDHTCTEVNTDRRCEEANIALRRAMATVLGPTAINEKKFTPWRTENRSLGLIWNTSTGSVSIPDDKMDKVAVTVERILIAQSATKRDLDKLLGVFRHVATCFPSARAFYQRLHSLAVSMRPFTTRSLADDVLEDRRWFRAIVQHKDRFNGIPVSQLAGVAQPSVHVYMDASNTGFCALEPQRKEYIRWRYTQAEQAELNGGLYENSINVRELQSAVLAALMWGSRWRQTAAQQVTHIRLHIDNTSAVAWASRRHSRHPIAQLYNRLLPLAELEYQLVFTAEHIPGRLNTMADAGSRAWTDSHPLSQTWSNLSSSWSQVVIEPPYDNLSAFWDRHCDVTPWPGLRTRNITSTGNSGANSPSSWDGHPGVGRQADQVPPC